MNDNVIPLHQKLVPAEPVSDEVPWFFGSVVSQVNEELLESEEAFHSRAVGLVEGINLTDQMMLPLISEANAREKIWKAHEDQASHVPMLRMILCHLLNLGIFAAELVLAATTFRGLKMDNAEVYIAATGSVSVAFMLTKIIAGGLRWWPYRTERIKKTHEACMLGLATTALVAMLAGMGLARVTFAEAEAATGGAGVSNVALWGLSALQAGMYIAQIAVFYFLLPTNPVAHLARANFQAARKRIESVLKRRAGLAKRLNVLGNKLRTERDRRVENGKRLMVAYLGAMHRADKGALLNGLSTSVRDDWFRPVSTRVPLSVDAPPTSAVRVMTSQS